jgi:hypothetical protein
MTTKEILNGIKYRITNLEKALGVLSKEGTLDSICDDYQSRLDELESIYHWIEEDLKDEESEK